MKIDSLPPDYIPFQEIDVCGNRLIEGLLLFTINDHVPLLIGNGKIPRIWLSIPADHKAQTWRFLVRDNKSLHSKVKIHIVKSTIEIDTPEGVVLKVTKESKEKAKMITINLHPFGMEIYGEATMLKVMKSEFVGNVFNKVRVMVAIKSKDKKVGPIASPT